MSLSAGLMGGKTQIAPMATASAVPVATATAVPAQATVVSAVPVAQTTPGMPQAMSATFEGDVQEAKILRTVQRDRPCTDVTWAVVFCLALVACLFAGMSSMNAAMVSFLYVHCCQSVL
eukprot:SAG22_NODE_3437_length_1711_cov_2.285183_3_plen_119_part_00